MNKIGDDLNAAYEEGYNQGKKDAIKEGIWIAAKMVIIIVLYAVILLIRYIPVLICPD